MEEIVVKLVENKKQIINDNRYELPLDIHLLLVEGLNGAGKTTYIRNFTENCDQYERIITYRGKGIHPVDLSRIAYFTEKDFKTFLDILFQDGIVSPKKYIEKYVLKEDDHILVNYLPIIGNLDDKSKAVDFARSHELYDGYATPEKFCDAHLNRWKQFGKTSCSKNTLAIFEAVTLQYPLMELIAFQNKNKEQILSYIKACIESVISWNPMLIYLEVRDIEKNIMAVWKERKHTNNWLVNFKKWLSHSPNFVSDDNDGISMVIEFMKKRREVEHYVINHLDIPVCIITREDLC